MAPLKYETSPNETVVKWNIRKIGFFNNGTVEKGTVDERNSCQKIYKKNTVINGTVEQ